jgi:uncharacterized protein
VSEAPGAAAAAVIRRLGLARHPEGGWYRETFRAAPPGGGRGACTAIYYLLAAGERSAWHRVDAVEIWNWYASSPLRLGVAANGGPAREHRLGNDLAAGEAPQLVVPAGAWQSAIGLGAWTLVGCVVAPAFEFAGFELAPPGWEPPSPAS